MIRHFNPSANSADFYLLLSAYLEIANNPEALRFLSYTGKSFTETQVTAWFKTQVENGIEYYVDCGADDQIQGIAVVKIDSTAGFELLSLVVRVASRKQGIGKGLVAHVMKVAGERGFKSMDVSVFADNLPMLQLVISLGFIPISMTYHARYDGADVLHLKCCFK